jgi:hypothetical protein
MDPRTSQALRAFSQQRAGHGRRQRQKSRWDLRRAAGSRGCGDMEGVSGETKIADL